RTYPRADQRSLAHFAPAISLTTHCKAADPFTVITTPQFGDREMTTLELFRNKKSGRLSSKNHGGSPPMGMLIRDDRQMKALTGLSQAQFNALLPAFSDIYQAAQQKTYEDGVKSGTRRRKPGGGCKG